MSDPWKLQVVWQRLIENETMQYASFAENLQKQRQKEAAAEAALLGVASQGVQTDDSLRKPTVEPSRVAGKKSHKKRKGGAAAAAADLPWEDRINQLPIACSSTGTFQHRQRPASRQPVTVEKNPLEDRGYRHGLVEKFQNRNPYGGFYTS
ncbi:hypothetical protein FOZ63_031597 [Perkinsus olseni]|uniref:Uncharacterized protein n=1 Tax=Perkinsus olseni TaxID=32597 RepID=A0A7J6THH9_PEROL|nr:hypothetical protein FOZ63_031597 [Perkinsus olseni]KAF4755219.1 hypothetical protein FOZ62_025068 [Perkinsus olseni]